MGFKTKQNNANAKALPVLVMTKSKLANGMFRDAVAMDNVLHAEGMKSYLTVNLTTSKAALRCVERTRNNAMALCMNINDYAACAARVVMAQRPATYLHIGDKNVFEIIKYNKKHLAIIDTVRLKRLNREVINELPAKLRTPRSFMPAANKKLDMKLQVLRGLVIARRMIQPMIDTAELLSEQTTPELHNSILCTGRTLLPPILIIDHPVLRALWCVSQFFLPGAFYRNALDDHNTFSKTHYAWLASRPLYGWWRDVVCFGRNRFEQLRGGNELDGGINTASGSSRP